MCDSPQSSASVSQTSILDETFSSSDYSQNILDSLKTFIPANLLCLYCEKKFLSDCKYKPCCSSTCWSATTVLSVLLSFGLVENQETSITTILRLRDEKDIEMTRLLNIMAAVIINCRHQRTRRVTRKLFQGIQKSSNLFVVPRCLHLDPEKVGHIPSTSHAFGGFADIRKSKYYDDQVAIKYLKADHTDDRYYQRKFIYEVLLWKSVRHKRLLSLHGVIDRGQKIGMVSPFCEYGPIKKFLKTMVNHEDKRYRWGFFHRFLLYRWALQIAEGLEYLHGEGIAHGDLHPGNILLTQTKTDPGGNIFIDVLLTDFGLSIYHQDQCNTNDSARGGPVVYTAPEIHLKEPSSRPTQKSDCFSWAGSVYTLFMLRPPYDDRFTSNDECRTAIENLELPNQTMRTPAGKETYDVTMPEDLWTLVAGCWAHHEQRITLGAIIDKLKSMEISVEDIVSRWKEQKL